MKTGGSFASVTRGVSQQAPADRVEGQHGEVVNMIADPVRGMVRRNGMLLEDEVIESFTADPSDALVDSYSFRAFSYRDGDDDFDILFRSREQVGATTDAHLPGLLARRKTLGTEGWLDTVFLPGDPLATQILTGGFSAVTSIGSYVLTASNNTVPAYDTEDAIENNAWRFDATVWVRGGSYNRKYTVRAKRRSTGLIATVEYTTPGATYPEPANTNPLDHGHPSWIVDTPWYAYWQGVYQREYDNAVSAWAVSSSAAIIPSNIAAELATRLHNSGIPGWSVRGSHIFNNDIEWIEVNDGGDGDFLRAVLTNVSDTADLTEIARVGKVVRVRPDQGTNDEYYVKAYAKVDGNTDPYQTVIWREAAGKIQKPTFFVGMGRVYGGVFYWASTPARLKQLLLDETGDDVDVPTFVDSTAGDLDSMPPPAFFRRPITLLTVFQDRLIVGSGSVVNMSESGDYFNFYRTTMLTIPDSDPVEFSAAGTESDTLRTAVQYDQNLLLQGDNFHYGIQGKAGIQASAPKMNVAFSLKGAAYAQPIGIGKYVYLLKDDPQLAASRLLQIQAGVYQDSPEVNDVSKQLRDYLNGSPAEMVALTVPGVVFVRTEFFLRSKGGFPRARPWGLYLYQYLDGDDGSRLTDAWGAWEWSTALGTPIGITDAGTGDSALLYTVSFGADADGGKARGLLVFKANARPDPSGLPYLDGLRPAETAETEGMWTPNAVQAVQDVVYTAAGAANSYDAVPATSDADRFTGLEHPHYTVGDAPPESVDSHRWDGSVGWISEYMTEHPESPTNDLWTGVAYPAFVDLTNPFVRDREGKAQTRGELNLTEFFLTLTRTAGVKASWIDHDGTVMQDGFREAYQRIRYNQSVWIGRESKDVQVRVEAVDWLPLTINGIQWTGNWFPE